MVKDETQVEVQDVPWIGWDVEIPSPAKTYCDVPVGAGFVMVKGQFADMFTKTVPRLVISFGLAWQPVIARVGTGPDVPSVSVIGWITVEPA